MKSKPVYIKTKSPSVVDMIENIKIIFGLNLSQIARIIGVSRSAIYEHINDVNADTEDYVCFYRLSVEVGERFGCVSSILKNIFVNDRTLLRHLECSYKDTDLIMSIIEEIKDYKPIKHINLLTISEQKRVNMIYIGRK